MPAPDPVHAVVDHDNGTVTVAVTFRWAPPNVLAMDHCKVGSFLGQLREAIREWLTKPQGWGTTEYAGEQPVIQGFSYQCYEPNEERRLGYIPDYANARCGGCERPARARNSAPWWEHTDPIPVMPDGTAVCHWMADDHSPVVTFPNLLDVDLTKGLWT